MSALAMLGAGTASQEAQAAEGAPAWKLTVASEPTNFKPGSVPQGFSPFGRYSEYDILATNVGSGPSSGPITISDTLPEGLTPVAPVGRDSGIEGEFAPVPCAVFEQTVTCTDPHPIGPGRVIQVAIPVLVSADAPASVVNEASVVGGGSGEARGATTTTISPEVAAFGIASGSAGLSLALTGSEAAPVTQAGSHPYQVTVDTGFRTAPAGEGNLIAAGHLRDLRIDLPRGMVLDPTATPVRCTETQLESDDCPDASAIGFASFQTILLAPEVGASPLYNMVTPAGATAELGFNPFGLGLVYLHLLGGLDSSGENELSLSIREILARPLNPVISVQVQLWGDPSDPTHDGVRGECVFAGASCPVKASSEPFLTMPGSCSGLPLSLGVSTDSWEEPGQMLSYRAGAEDSLGGPVSLDGCNRLEFEPRIEVKPTTNLADAPSGLDLDLSLPQSQDLGRLAKANLKDATITLPEGMAINPSFATGTGVCTQTQVDLRGPEPASCPQSSSLGTVTVKTPLLDRPLSGALYLAKPFENPFGSSFALYLAIDDPDSGVVIKLPGKVEADPRSGRLHVSFPGSPELPFEELSVHLFGGPRAPLRTPATCGVHTVSSQLVPWSAPEGADATPPDRFATTVAPGGGLCAREEAAAPHAPSLTAGTIAPQAGARSPLVFRLSREDATQALGGVDATLPEGLLADLSGLSQCMEAQIVGASPSCPSSSEVGTANVAVGAGIAPLHLQGHAYLAGPYEGAPLSLAAIVPAVAGPFDLGTVMVRSALHVDPQTTRIHVVSDPFPQILDGIPLDLRSISIKLDRPGLILNPTSCDPMLVSAVATAALGSGASLSSRFQLGNCRALGFEPKLSLRLGGAMKRGAHPALRATLAVPKARQANLATAQLTLPRSLGLDRGAIKAGSAYGRLTARTPLLDRPLKGPISLRTSKRGPELVATLKGEGIEVTSAAKLETKGGRLIADFEAIPDTPVSKVVLEIEGGRRGLLVNKESLCKKPGRAEALFTGQNGKAYEASPTLAVPCKGASPRRRGAHR